MAKKKTKPKGFKPAFLEASDLDPKKPKPGIYLNVPLLAYLSIDAFSQSMATKLLKSPAHLQAYLRKQKDTDAIRLGKLTDTMLFDGDKQVKLDFVQAPETYKNADGETKDWKRRGGSKAAKAHGEELTKGGQLVMVSRDAWEASEAMCASVRKHAAAKDVLADGVAQVTMIWEDPDTGILCKGRTDWWRVDSITDLKTTKEGGAHPLEWPRQMFWWRYDVQCGAYLEGRRILTGQEVNYWFIVVEKEDPFNVMHYVLGPDTQGKGERSWSQACKLYAECQAINQWPGYSSVPEITEMYSYHLNEGLTPNDVLGGFDNYEF